MPSVEDMLIEARQQLEARPVAASRMAIGGVDPLGLRQINFDLMDQVLPDLNNVARHVRPYIVMAWAWRRVRTIVKSTGIRASQLFTESKGDSHLRSNVIQNPYW